MNKEQFVLEVRSLGIEVTEKKLKKLDEFYNLLILWNEKINLTTITAIQDVYLKHFYDSLTLFRVCDLTKDINICDVGSGAGFPGIVLKIFFPNLKITLVDSLNKRVNYLNTIIKELGLVNIEAVHSRMEDFSKVNEEKYDIITARAVANLSVLSEISVKALKIHGKLVFMKALCDDELEMVLPKLSILGLKFNKVDKFLLPIEESNRSLIVFEKIKTTPNKYPRNIDKIKKNPL